MRCVHEAELHKQNCFITLTYNPENLPEDSSLSLEDFQLFMKRFRKKYSDVKIRFFHCGEYGAKNERPHDHAIIFGFDFPDKQLLKTVRGNPVYTSEILAGLWGKGFCTVGAVTFESAAYVARYVLKKVTGEMAEGYYDGRRPEYVTMSRREGIAADWYEKYKTDVYPQSDADEKRDEVIIRGKPMKPPRFYDNRLKLQNREMYDFIKACRKNMAELYEVDDIELAKKEKVKIAQTRGLIRHIQF